MKSRLHIEVGFRGGGTYLRNSFCSPPFKLANITGERNCRELTLMVMSSSPGILDEDDYSIYIELDEGTHTVLETQSYQRLFQMKTGARQQLELHMRPSSTFEYIPHPSVPHYLSNFVATNKIYLAENCSLIWGEILTCGRKSRGEVFSFSKFQSVTEIFLSNKLIVKENLLIAPAITDVAGIGLLEGYTHQASLLCIGKQYASPVVVESILSVLIAEKNVCSGVSALENGNIVRFLGYHAEQLYNCLKKISELLKTVDLKAVSVKTFDYAG